MQSSKELQGKIFKKAFLSYQCKEIEENSRMRKTRDLFKKIRDKEGTFHAKVGTIKDRNDMEIIESEDIKKRLKKYIELYKKDINDPDNHDGVITHLELDILRCTSSGPSEVSLGAKPVEVMELQLSYFKS